MSVLVTGGAGYIGSVLVPTLLRAGYRVTVLDNFLYRQDTLLECCQYEDFQIVRGDSRDPDVIRPRAAGRHHHSISRFGRCANL